MWGIKSRVHQSVVVIDNHTNLTVNILYDSERTVLKFINKLVFTIIAGYVN